MAKGTKVTRPVDELTVSIKELGKHVTNLASKNKILDKSLKFDANPLATLTERAKNTAEAITALTQRIEKMKEKQEENFKLLAKGELSQQTYDAMALNIAKAELQLKELNAEQIQTNKLIEKLPLKKFEELGEKVSKAGQKMTALGQSTRGLSLLAGGALAGIAALGLGAIKSGDDLATMSAQLGISAEELQYLQFIAMQTDVPLDKMTNAFKKAKDALGTQLMGDSNAATKALDYLKISASDYDSNLEAFYAIAESLKNVSDSSVQAALANDLFGAKMGSELLPFINAGGDALKEYTEQLDRIGILSNDTVKELSDFDNEMNEIKMSFQQAGMELGVALLPVIKDFAVILKESIIPFIKDVVDKFNNMSTESKETIIKVLMLTAAFSPLMSAGGRVVKMIGELIPKIAGMTREVKLASLGWLALGAAAAVSFDLITNWKNMGAIEKILKTLAVAALVAAAAVTVFHASWSIGIAVGAIAAGVVAGIAAISAAATDIGVEMPSIGSGGVSNGSIEMPDYTKMYNDAESGYNDMSKNYTDNSTTHITIVNEAGDADRDILDKINRALMQQKQART